METVDIDESYDSKLKQQKHINFLPFVGKEYNKSTPRILVLGESHYIDDIEMFEKDNNDHLLTRDFFMQDYLGEIRDDGSHPYKFVRCWRNTAAMIAAKGYPYSDFIWNKLAFYNFFQRIVGVESEDKKYINDDLIELSQKAYFEVLDVLKPDFVIAWGISELYYDWVPQDNCELIDEANYLYRYKDKPDITIWHIRHPSMGFSYEAYHEDFIKMLNKIGLDASKLI